MCMVLSLIDKIEEQKRKNIQTYLIDIKRLFSDFGSERSTTEEYNGRQILELLQNADDAHSSEVQIELDTSKCLLIISNKGEPFSREGYESLMLIGNTSKTNKRLFIGCKGLGFRSILNWANKIEVFSNNCKVIFSQEIAMNCIETEFCSKNDEIAQLKIKKGYTESAFTYPILALPQIEECIDNSEWVTQIVIHYKPEFLEDIQKQISTLSPEVLLFVRSISDLKIINDGGVDEFHVDIENKDSFSHVRLSSKINNEEKNSQYRVFKRSGLLPAEFQIKNDRKEPLYYETAIAVGEDLTIDENYLYSFFRTDIKIPLPCIIHGSFDLNASRTLINDTKINDFILRKITHELLRVALFIRNDSPTASWNSFELLRLRQLVLLNKLENFEKDLRRYLSISSILPCVDDKYRPLSDVIYYSDEMSTLVAGGDYGNYFQKMLKVKQIGKPWGEMGFRAGKIYKENYFWTTFDSICKTDDLSIEKRIGLIRLLNNLMEKRVLANGEKNKISILIDDNGNPIDKECRVYTPAPYKIIIPDFMNVQFINQPFYEALCKALGAYGDALCSRIGTFVNLKSYDLAELTPAIIRKSNEMVKESAAPQLIIKKTINALYHNHLLAKKRPSGFVNKYDGITLVNRKGDLVSPDELYFSKTYENGVLTEKVYEHIISDEEYLIDKEFWEIEDDEELEEFFILLGVSRNIKYEGHSLSVEDKDYFDSLLKDCKEYNLYKDRWPHNMVYCLADLPKIKQLSPSKILLLLSAEPELSKQVLSPRLQFKKPNYKGKYDVGTDYSYIAYQLKPLFEKVVADIDDKDIDRLVDESLKIDYPFLEQNGLRRERANELLRHTYVKKDLDELDTQMIYSMLEKIPQEFPDGKNVQKIYNRVLDILKNREIDSVPEGLLLACYTDDKFEYKFNTEIFCYDVPLPKSVLRNFPILLLRQRATCDNVCKVFGVNKIIADAIGIDQSAIEVDEDLSASFEVYLKKHWACILAYRLLEVNETRKKESEARRLAKLKIRLIASGKYSFNGKEFDFEDFDFVSDGNDAYIKVPTSDLELLIKRMEFLDACAEILMMLFRLDDTRLKSLFRDTIRSDADDREKEICSDYKYDYLRECKELLGIDENLGVIFWNKILDAKGLPLLSNLESEEIRESVGEVLSISLPPNYCNIVFFDLHNDAFIGLLKILEKDIQISLSCCLTGDGLTNYHRERIGNSILDFIDKFKSLLWKKKNSLPKEDKQSRIDFKSDVWRFRNLDQEIDFRDYMYKVNVDYNGIVIKYAQEVFGIDLNQDDPNPYHEKYLYELPDGNETALPEDLAGLVYFEGYDSLFEEFRTISKKEVEMNKRESSSDEFSDVVASLATIQPTNEEISSPEKKQDALRLPRNHSPKVDRVKQEHGKSAQNTVVQWLASNNIEYRERCSTSQAVDKDDGAHCDIEYKPNKQSEWRFLEVKFVSRDTFEITNAEIDHACKPENQKRYDLAIVKDGHVYIIKAPFANETKKSFIEKYKAVETSYTVKFKLMDNGQNL